MLSTFIARLERIGKWAIKCVECISCKCVIGQSDVNCHDTVSDGEVFITENENDTYGI